jgi:uncharacterized protein
VHGLEEYGFGWLGHAIHDAAEAAAHSVPVLPGLAGWLVSAAGAGLVGLALGLVLIPIAGHVLGPAGRWLAGLFGRRGEADHSG